MNFPKLKITICLVWLIVFSGLVLIPKPLIVTGKNIEPETIVPKPDLKDVENFNSLIQNRFLTAPGFGMARIEPTPPYSNHLSSFYPKDELEKKAVQEFERTGWKVGLYLFGKTTEKKIKNDIGENEFLINYRLKQPVIITNNIKKRTDLSNSKRILKKVKEAFTQFQESKNSEEKPFEFATDGLWYFAKPVRAINESCVKCHSDYVIVKKLEDGKYQFRPRKVGDVNGVLVFSFQQVKK